MNMTFPLPWVLDVQIMLSCAAPSGLVKVVSNGLWSNYMVTATHAGWIFMQGTQLPVVFFSINV